MTVYTAIHETPPVEVYRMLRVGSGLSAKSELAAVRGLANSLFAVQILGDGVPIGMGRVIGDGGCFYQVVDIAVLPNHQGQGLGKRIMQDISAYLRQHAPETAYVSLIADGEARHLYAQYGFELTAPASVGMAFER